MAGIESISKMPCASLGYQFIETRLQKHSSLKCLAHCLTATPLLPADSQGAGCIQKSSFLAAAPVSSGRATRKKAVELAAAPGSADFSEQRSISRLPSSSCTSQLVVHSCLLPRRQQTLPSKHSLTSSSQTHFNAVPVKRQCGSVPTESLQVTHTCSVLICKTSFMSDGLDSS